MSRPRPPQMGPPQVQQLAPGPPVAALVVAVDGAPDRRRWDHHRCSNWPRGRQLLPIARVQFLEKLHTADLCADLDRRNVAFTP